MGVANDDQRRWLFQPMAEIILDPDPKSPRVLQVPARPANQLYLEPLANSFCDFMNESAQRALADAKANINLSHESFLR
jgi:hypothetical protein